jgi:hypothetical protein
MLRILAGVFALIAFASISLSQPSGPRESEHKTDTAASNDDKSSDLRHLLPPSPQSQPPIINVYTNKHANEESKCTDPKDWKEWVSFAWCRSLEWIDPERIIAIWTVILGVATAFLWSATKRLVKGAEDTARKQLRAYIGVEPGGIIRLQGSDLLLGHYIIRNVGGIPAKNIAMFAVTSYFRDGSQRTFNIGQLYQTTNAIVPHAKMIFGTATGTNVDSLADAEEYETASGLDGFIFVWGRVTYTDEFGTDGRTDFCHRYPCAMLEDGIGGRIDRKYARYHELGGNNAT